MNETDKNGGREGQVVVVTGSSGGIGRATALAFAARGAKVALLARGEEGLAGAVRDVEAAGGVALPIPTDVADPDQVEAAAEKTEQTLGPIDVWVNVAFTSVFAQFQDIKPAEYKRVTEVSYLGYVYGTMAALSRMLPRDAGTIVQVGSALAYRGIPLQTAYCGAKHAIQGFNESLRCELLHNKSNVHVTMVQMPAVNTPQFDWVLSRLPKPAQPVPPIYQPEVAAHGVLYAADHPGRREYWVGGTTAGTLAANAIAPGLLDRYLARTGYSAQEDDRAEPRPARSTCGSRPTGRPAMITPPTAASTPRPSPAVPSCGPPSIMACSAGRRSAWPRGGRAALGGEAGEPAAGGARACGAVQSPPAYSAEQLLGGPLSPAAGSSTPPARVSGRLGGVDAHALSMEGLAAAAARRPALSARRRPRFRAARARRPSRREGEHAGLPIAPPPVRGIDRIVRNVRTGRFERSLSALTAAGALVTAAEIYFEHDSASFGNKMMWIPVALGPAGAAAGVAGFFSRRAAKTALPIASAAIVANGLQGTYLHARGIAQKPGGWSNARYNIEMGPPLLAPLLVTMVGGMGLLAAILRREP